MTINRSAAVDRSHKPDRRLRVAIVDDSVVIRGLVTRWIDAEPDLEMVGSFRNGLDAVNQFEAGDPDIVVLDIEMPVLDGLSALPQLLARKPKLIVIVASTFTTSNAEMSLKALAMGAADYIAKPQSTRAGTAADDYRKGLLGLIRATGLRCQPDGARLRGHDALPAAARPASSAAVRPSPSPSRRPKVLLIGASTGGPKALAEVMVGLRPIIDQVPVLIAQHMPPVFTAILAEQLAKACGRPVREGVDGETVEKGRIYLAPGGLHMRVAKRGADIVIALDDGPQINFCKPAVDPLFSSAVQIWQGDILAVILTGMGSDGTGGGKTIVAAGGRVIAQDEASSVVWGMPGAAAQAGICSSILPLKQITPTLVRIFSGLSS